MGKGKILDWVNIKRDYVNGFYVKKPDGSQRLEYPTYDELAEKYNCHSKTLSTVGGKEKWTSEREIRQKKLQKLAVNDSANLDDSVKYDIQNLLRLEQIGELIDKWIRARIEPDEKGRIAQINAKDLTYVIDALSKTHQLARNILGESVNGENKSNVSNHIKINQQKLSVLDPATLDSIKKIIAAKEKKLKMIDPANLQDN